MGISPLHVTSVSHLARKRFLCRLQLGAIVTAGEQVAVHVGRHVDGGMPEAVLHRLERQPKPAILFAVEAPRRVEVPQRVEARVLGLATLGDAGSDLSWRKPAGDDVGVIFNLTRTCRKHQGQFAWRTSHFPLPQRVHHDRGKRHRPLPRHALGLTDGVELVGPLPHLQLGLFEINIIPLQAAELRGTQAGEYRSEKEGPPAAAWAKTLFRAFCPNLNPQMS
jgi:hypothetical protein